MIAWKQDGQVQASEDGLFIIEPKNWLFVAYRFEDIADTYPVEQSPLMLLPRAQAWCEQRVAMRCH